MRRGDIWSGEFVVQKRDRHAATVLGTVSALRDDAGAVVGWIGVAADLSERVKVAQVDKRRAEEMALLYRLGVSLTSGKDLYDTLLALQGEITKLLQADAFYVAIYDIEIDIVMYPIFFDEGSPVPDLPHRLHERPGLTGAVIFSGKTLYLTNKIDPEVQKNYSWVDDNGFILYTFLGITLITDGNTIGMLSLAY